MMITCLKTIIDKRLVHLSANKGEVPFENLRLFIALVGVVTDKTKCPKSLAFMKSRRPILLTMCIGFVGDNTNKGESVSKKYKPKTRLFTKSVNLLRIKYTDNQDVSQRSGCSVCAKMERTI